MKIIFKNDNGSEAHVMIDDILLDCSKMAPEDLVIETIRRPLRDVLAMRKLKRPEAE